MTTNPVQLAPYSQQAEEAVLGAVMVNPEALLDVAAYLDADDFYIVRHRYIWEAMKRISDRDETIDFVTVQNELSAINRLNDIGGPAYLLTLVNSTPDSTQATSYGHLVERTALRRRMLRAADDIKALALDEQLEANKAYLDGLQRYDAIQPRDRERFVPGTLSILDYDVAIRELMQRQGLGELVGYPLPDSWGLLRDALPMVFPGDFVVITGGPGSGKSAMLESWAEWTASLPVKTDYLHTEMNTQQVLHRRMARHSGVPYHLLASGQVKNLYARLQEADEEIHTFAENIAYHWLPDVEFVKLANELRRAALRGVKFFFIDHFQDIQPHVARGGNEVRAFEQMCIWLAAFAEKRQVVVVVASQVNAQGKTKWTKKLEEKAVIWLSIKRDRLNAEYSYRYDGVEVVAHAGEDSPAADVTINKARFGKKARLKMLYHGPRFQWLDMSRIQRPQFSGKTISIEELQAQAAEDARKAGF